LDSLSENVDSLARSGVHGTVLFGCIREFDAELSQELPLDINYRETSSIAIIENPDKTESPFGENEGIGMTEVPITGKLTSQLIIGHPPDLSFVDLVLSHFQKAA